MRWSNNKSSRSDDFDMLTARDIIVGKKICFIKGIFNFQK